MHSYISMAEFICVCFFILRQINKNRGQNHIENNYNNKYKRINVRTRSVNRIYLALVSLFSYSSVSIMAFIFFFFLHKNFLRHYNHYA